MLLFTTINFCFLQPETFSVANVLQHIAGLFICLANAINACHLALHSSRSPLGVFLETETVECLDPDDYDFISRSYPRSFGKRKWPPKPVLIYVLGRNSQCEPNYAMWFVDISLYQFN